MYFELLYGMYGSALTSLYFPIPFRFLLYQNAIIEFHITVRLQHLEVIAYLEYSHDCFV